MSATCNAPAAAISGLTSLRERRPSTLHRVLAWACIPIGIGIAFGGLFGFGSELDGGIFGGVWFISGFALTVWMVGVSVVLLRRSRVSANVAVPHPAST